jgi:hypothetical protein
MAIAVCVEETEGKTFAGKYLREFLYQINPSVDQ